MGLNRRRSASGRLSATAVALTSACGRLSATAVTLLLLLAAAAPPARASTPALPSSDPFYTYSGTTPLAQIAPGTVLSRRPIQFAPTGSAGLFDGEQVLYRTTGEQGQPTVTVTTILEPLLPLLGDKIVSYQTAYDALGSECDPSYTLTGGNPGYSTAQSEATIIEGYLAAGMTVVVPDYEGTNLEWGAGQESGYGTLDGVRAAESWMGVSSTTPVAMVGYSGGSIATEWASELAPSYAPGLNIVGAAAGGIPVDFAHNLAYVNGSQGWSGVIPAILVGISRAFGVSLDQYLSPYGAKVIAQVGPECINNFFGDYPGLTIQQLLKPQYQNILAIPTFARIINKLIMGTSPGRPTWPLLMAVGNQDGTGDGVMVDGDDEALAHEYCQEGVPVNFTEFQGSDHGAAAIPFEASALTFVISRFAGLPAINGCGSIGAGNSLAPLTVAAGTACPLATGTLAGGHLGLARLGMTRAQARTAFAASADRPGRRTDTFCLALAGVRVGYATASLAHGRHGVRSGTVVWAATANTYYALAGVRPGASAAVARRRLHLGRGLRAAGAWWYFTRRGARVGVIALRRGAVEQVGVADGRIAPRSLLRAFA